MYNFLEGRPLMMPERDNESFPIRTVSEMTGVNSVTLRAWERRYGLIKPKRTPKGHRVYTYDHIRLIQEILDRMASGASIGQIARDISNGAAIEAIDSDVWTQYRKRMVEAIVRFDDRQLDSVYNDAMSLYPVDVVTARLIMPLLEELGSRWEMKSGSIAEEHFFSVYLRNKLGARFHHQNLKNTGPRLIAACLPGEHHEFGILLFALMAHSKGYQVILLGADLPVTELTHVVERTDSQAVVLAGSSSLQCEQLYDDLGLLTDALSIPVFVGGDVSATCPGHITRAGAYLLGQDLSASLHTVAGKLKSMN